MLGLQLDLFADRHLRVESARRAMGEGRAEDAFRELAQLCRRYPDDAAITAELDRTRALLLHLEQIAEMSPDERPVALLGLARMAVPSARAWLLRRAAVALREARGSTGLVDGKPASALWIEAGEAGEAGDLQTGWALAAEAVRDSPRARFLAYLADIEHRLGQQGRSRARYREALAADPFDVDWSAVADEDVKALPDIAQTEYDLDDGVAWAAPVGVVLKVLPLGEPPLCDALPTGGPLPPALARARGFLLALLRAAHDRDASAIDARRQMRALAPGLLAAYLETR